MNSGSWPDWSYALPLRFAFHPELTLMEITLRRREASEKENKESIKTPIDAHPRPFPQFGSWNAERFVS